MSSENNYAAGGVTEGDGFSAKYSAGDLSVRYGVQDNKDDTEMSYVALTYSMAGIGLAAEQYTSTTAAGVDTDTDSMSLTYSTGDITLAIETQKESSAGATSDITTMGIHYGMGGGVTAFVENTDDEQDAGRDHCYWCSIQVLRTTPKTRTLVGRVFLFRDGLVARECLYGGFPADSTEGRDFH